MSLTTRINTILLMILFIFVIGGNQFPASIDCECGGPEWEKIFQTISSNHSICLWEESIVNLCNEGMNVVCSLVIPQTRNKCAIVIMLNGFTGNRNDGFIPGTNEQIWPRLSRILAENGIASLRIDFRGSGDSDGDYSMTTFSTQISDVRVALNYIVKNLNQLILISRIGIFGYSQGAIIGSSVAATDKRIKSMVFWSPVTNVPLCYEGLLTKQGLKSGLAIPDYSVISLGIYVNDSYIADITLGKSFIQEIFRIDPMKDIQSYSNPLLVIVGLNDTVVWPQPEMGSFYLKYHDGCEKILVMDTDHFIGSWNGPDIVDEASFKTAAWFLLTLKGKE